MEEGEAPEMGFSRSGIVVGPGIVAGPATGTQVVGGLGKVGFSGVQEGSHGQALPTLAHTHSFLHSFIHSFNRN